MCTVKIIWVTAVQMFQTTEGRQGDGGERREEASVSVAPIQSEGAGLRCNGSIHQKHLGKPEGRQAPAEALEKSRGQEGGRTPEHQAP